MILGILLAIVLLYIGVSWYVANALTSLKAPIADYSPQHVADHNYEDVTFLASDGVRLAGWFFQGRNDKLIIFVTGIKSTRSNMDYFGLGIAHELVTTGYSVLMYDARGTGDSAPSRLTYGVNEGNDVEGAVSFAKQRGFNEKNIGIIADSGGTASVLLHIDQLKGIGAIVLDSPFARLQPVISRALWREQHISPLFYPGIYFFTKSLFGLDTAKANPVDSVSHIPDFPLLILYGREDATIPIKDPQEISSKANKQSQLIYFDKAQHIGSYRSDPVLYRKEVLSYLENQLNH